MNTQPHAKYTPRNTEWLGTVPRHWDVKRGRFCMSVNPSSPRPRTLGRDDEVSFVPMEAVGEYGGLSLELTQRIGEIGAGYTEFQDGDVVVAKITPCFENGKGALAAGLTNGVALGTTELHVLRSLSELDRRFLFYLTISSVYRAAGESEMYGAGGQKRVPTKFIKDFRTPIPSIPEQRAIAELLDRQTATLDSLMTRRRALIEKLQEKRSALIIKAVTKGLDPNVPMKPSRVAWLGDVPEHWNIRPLR